MSIFDKVRARRDDTAVQRAKEHVRCCEEYQHAGRIPEALREAEEAVRLDPNNADGYYGLGRCNHALARADNERANGNIYFRAGLDNLERAIVAYRKVVSLQPTAADGFFSLGLACDNACRLEEAEKNYMEAIRLDPVGLDGIDARSNLALLLHMQAIGWAGQKEFPNSLRLYLDDTRLARSFELAEESIRLAEQRLQRDPGYLPEVIQKHRVVAGLYDRVKREAGAIFHHQAIVRLKEPDLPSLPPAHLVRSESTALGRGMARSGGMPRRQGAMCIVGFAVVFAPNGRLLAIAFPDRNVTVNDTSTGDVLHTLKGHSGSVRSIVFSPDSTLLASGSRDRTVKLWDVTTGSLLRTLEGHLDRVTCVAFSKDGGMVASGSSDATVKLWDTRTGALLRTLEEVSGYVLSVAFSSGMLASGSSDETVKLWDTRAGRLMQTFHGHSGWITSVAWSSDGKLLASGSEDRTVRLWQAHTGRLVQTLEGHRSIVNSVAFSPDGKTLASVSDDRTVNVWDVATGQLLLTQVIRNGDKPVSVAVAPDVPLIAVAIAPTSLIDALRRIQVRTRGAVRTRGPIKLT